MPLQALLTSNDVAGEHMSVQMLLDLFPRAPTHSPRTGLAASSVISASVPGDQAGLATSTPPTVPPMPNASGIAAKAATKSAAARSGTIRRFSSFLARTTALGSTGTNLDSADSAGGTADEAMSSSAAVLSGGSVSDVTRRSSLFRLTTKRSAESEANLKLGSARSNSITGDSLITSTRDSPLMDSLSIDISDPDRLKVAAPSGLPADRDYVDLLKRACKGVIAPKDQDLLYKFLCLVSPSRMADLQRAVQEILADRTVAAVANSQKRSSVTTLTDAFRSSIAFVEVSKYNLDFGLKGRRAKLNKELRDTFTIDLKSGAKPKFTLKPPEKKATFYLLKIEPLNGRLKGGKEEVVVTLQLKRPAIMSEVIVLEIEGAYRHFFTINISSEWSNFGASLSDYQMVEDTVTMGHPRLVPEPLAILRSLFVKKNGLDHEEIFRKQVDEEQVVASRLQFDQKLRLDEMNCDTITSLIKVWFRELPERLFEVTVDQVVACETPEDITSLFESAVGPSRDVALWLFDLLAGVVAHKDTNRMNAKKLAIVMAPNVFPSSIGSTNAVYLRKQADIFCQLLERHAATVSPIFDDLPEVDDELDVGVEADID